MNPARLAIGARLARWLGPWTDDEAVPRGVRWREVPLPRRGDQRPMKVWTYAPDRAPQGAMLVTPGLHYLGPADCRLDRFCRVLAASGVFVVCPHMPDFGEMQCTPELGPDLARALDAMLAMPEVAATGLARVGLFSISFGSLPATWVARRRPEVGRLMLFGGFANFQRTLEFCVSGGGPGRPHDPLNCCAVLLNFLPHLDARDVDSLEQAWLAFIRLTWGRPYMKERAHFEAVARSLAKGLPDEELFLIGTRVLPGVRPVLDHVLERGHAKTDALDPRDDCRHITIPTTVAHGRDDDVIPWEESETLASLIPNAELFVTGAYSHTGSDDGAGQNPLAEARSTVGILARMAATAVPQSASQK